VAGWGGSWGKVKRGEQIMGGKRRGEPLEDEYRSGERSGEDGWER